MGVDDYTVNVLSDCRDSVGVDDYTVNVLSACRDSVGVDDYTVDHPLYQSLAPLR